MKKNKRKTYLVFLSATGYGVLTSGYTASAFRKAAKPVMLKRRNGFLSIGLKKSGTPRFMALGQSGFFVKRQ